MVLIASSGAGFSALNAAETARAIPDFAGYWARPEPGPWRIFHPPESGPGPIGFAAEAGEMRRGIPMIGDHTNPILLPHAAASVAAQRDQFRAGEVVWPAWSLCWPPGLPLALNMAEPVQFLQTEDQITILYQRGQQVRRIDLDRGHPHNPDPSWYGHSVGHYEGTDTLVIDTIAPDPRSVADRFGTPKSVAMRIVERYQMSADGQSIDVVFAVEDPKTFTMSWSSRLRYERLAAGSEDGPQDSDFAEIICPENNRDPGGGGFVIPIAAAPDF